jgi:D-alanyl-D-alanine carboxypeptidase (penicillin-binding protein 5/6)
MGGRLSPGLIGPHGRGIGLCITAAVVAAAIGVAQAASGPSSGGAGKKDEGFQTAAPHAILIDAESDNVLYDKNADTLIEPASLAKLMTVEVVINQIKEGLLKLSDEFRVSEYAWRHGGAPSHTSSMFVPIHSQVSVDALLHGAIIQSGNDACIVLAEGIAGNELAFAQKMTERARALDLPKSVFANATGLPDPATKVTTRELAKLAQHIIRAYPDFYRLFGEREFTFNRVRQQNRNPLLNMSIGADGLKTGYTQGAGYGLVGSAVQNGLRLIVVVNGARNEKERADEAKKLLEWGFRSFESKPLFAAEDTVGEAKVYGGAKGHVGLTAGRDVHLMVPRGGGEKITARVVYIGPVPAPVQEGQPIGKLKVWRGDSVALEVPLRAAESVGVGNVSQRAFDAVGELVIGLVRAGADRL